MITLRLHNNAIADDLDRLIDRISRPGPRQTRHIADAIRQQFAENFTRQGSGAGQWARLAPSTIAQRRRLGFAGQRPILVRTGRYRASFTQRGAANHYETVQYRGGYTTIDVGSDDERGEWLERGTRRMPARPVTLLGDDQSDNIMRVIDFVVRSLEREAIR
mgnify:FL=1